VAADYPSAQERPNVRAPHHPTNGNEPWQSDKEFELVRGVPGITSD